MELSVGLALLGAMIGFALLIRVGPQIVRLKSDENVAAEDLKKLQLTVTKLQIPFSRDSEYMRYSDSDSLKHRALQIRSKAVSVKTFVWRGKRKAVIEAVDLFLSELPKRREELNNRFFEAETERAKSILLGGSHPSTAAQISAVLSDDNRNLVIAGAGSGKTSVVGLKVRYLVRHKKVSPEKILILTFSTQAANELSEKISPHIAGLRAQTIHSFANKISNRGKANIFDAPKNEYEGLVIRALVATLKDAEVFKYFNLFYHRFFSSVRPLIFYQTLDELRSDLKKLNLKFAHLPDQFGELKAQRALKTLGGQFVRSVDERFIADFLYLHNIPYEYEKPYPHSAGTYHPDFYLPAQDIYLEHFAITASGRPPSYFDSPDKYMSGMEWKRELHARNGTRMIETFSYLLNGPNSSHYLLSVLREAGLQINEELAKEKAYSVLSKQFCEMFGKFYRSFRLSRVAIGDLKLRFTEPKFFLFLQVFERFIPQLEREVLKANKRDFDDMILEAIEKCRQGFASAYEYIIVDEFQDTSRLAMELIAEIHHCSPGAALVGVGDDWQSIYGFNGSDVSLFSSFSSRYPGVAECRLDANFRSHTRIVELGKRFITKNPAQVKKDVFSQNNNIGTSEIDFISLRAMGDKINGIPATEKIFILYRYNADCKVLHDILGDYLVFTPSEKSNYISNGRKNIHLLTMHASKGKEAQHVFILFPDGVRRKFPAEIEDHFVFSMLKSDTDSFPFSEERRLMYVAITRAKQNLYFVSKDPDPNSVFWDELKELVRDLPPNEVCAKLPCNPTPARIIPVR